MFGDINNFKAFNSRHGHDVADLALDAVGVQLLEVAQLCRGRAFRPSGDEFVLLLPRPSLERAVTEIGSRLGNCEVDLLGTVDVVAMGFGFARTTGDSTLSDLLERAERASNAAKLLGPGEVLEWSPTMDADALTSVGARCDGCGTTVGLMIPPRTSLPTRYACPVCATTLPL